jgi:uncharacterized membrane protein
MKRLRDLLVDGMLLALPLGVAAYLLYSVFVQLKKLLVPIAHLLPAGHFFRVAAVEIAAILALLLALVALGAFARSALGRRVGKSLEKVLMSKFPGYQMIRSMAVDFTGSEDRSDLRPALVTFDDNTVLGFIVEESAADDRLTIFIPGAPASGSGNVVLVSRERVRLLDVPTSSAMKSLRLRGLGLRQLAGPQSSK